MSKETPVRKTDKHAGLKSKIKKTAADLEAKKKVSAEVPVKVWPKEELKNDAQTKTDEGSGETRRMESPDDIIRRKGYKRFDF